MRTSVVGLLAVVATAAVAASQEQAAPAAPSAVLEKFLTSSDTPVTSHKALRRLSVAARGGKMTASRVAESSLEPERGFEYRVIEEEGSGFLRSRVLHPV